MANRSHPPPTLEHRHFGRQAGFQVLSSVNSARNPLGSLPAARGPLTASDIRSSREFHCLVSVTLNGFDVPVPADYARGPATGRSLAR